jgi:hypothetical protein
VAGMASSATRDRRSVGDGGIGGSGLPGIGGSGLPMGSMTKHPGPIE